MPRQGDGSSQNGPFEEGNIVHGNAGDVSSPAAHCHRLPTDARIQATLQHAKNNVAPMPEIEKGQGTLEPRLLPLSNASNVHTDARPTAIEGMNASGGGNAPDQAQPTVASDEPKKA
jgi:hypothetical protein